MNYRLIILTFSYILGAACAPSFNSWRAAAAAAFSAAGLFALNRARRAPEKIVIEKLLALLLLVFLCGFARGKAMIAEKDAGVNSRLAENAYVKLTGRAESVKYHALEGKNFFVTASLNVENYYEAGAGRNKKTSGKVLLKFHAGEDYTDREKWIGDGDLIEASGRIKRLHIFKNPYIGGSGNPLAAETLYSLEASSISVKLIERGFRPAVSLRNHARELFMKYYPPEVSGFLIAFVLGDSSGLSESVYFENGASFDFTESGMLHILVVSGGHITMMIAFAASALGAFGAPPRAKAAALFLIVTVYFLMIGFQAAATRAYLSFALFSLCRLLKRDVSAVNIFIAAFFFHSVVFSELIFSPGFWLSYISTAALIAAGGFGAGGNAGPGRWSAWLACYCKMSAAALASTFPVVSYSCGYFPANCILSNFLTLWIYECVLAMCFIFIVFSALSEWLAWAAAAAVYHSCFAAMKLNEAIGAVPLGNLAVYDLSLAETVLIYAAGATAFAFMVKNSKRLPAEKLAAAAAAAVLLLTLRSFGAGLMEGPEITFLDAGQGDCAAIRCPGGAWIFIDAGGSARSYEMVLLPFIRRRKISEIECLIITHAHADHYCNALKLYSNPKVRVKTLFYSKGWEDGDRDFRLLLAAAGENKTEIFAGDVIEAGGVSIDILWPERKGPEPGGARPATQNDARQRFVKNYSGGRPSDKGRRPKPDANASSIAAAVNICGRSFLFCGDITLTEEEKLLDRVSGRRFELIKAPHHGSRTSNGEKFLSAAAARAVFIPAGASNKFGHPHAEVVERYRHLGYTIFNSSYFGGLSLAIGRRIKIFGHDMKYSYL